ncbi:MAG: efflux RND transporter permease subunit, partial [Bacteroidetes bacterium]|nr:efflux RND transporter permease subunit [Bacteroidota bacterium]
MLGKIISFSVNNKLIIGLLVFALIVYGAYETTRLPIDAVPDITNNQVQVITVTPSLGAPDVERLITFPIEQANNNVPGLLEIRSFSRFGLSLVTIVFDDDVDIYWARQQVAERLQQVQQEIPEGIGKPFMAPVSTGLGEIYQYVVKPKKGYEKMYDAMQLRTIQDWIVRRQLLGVKGVADVSSFGGYLKQYEVAVDPNKLKSFGITINDVFDALEQNNRNTGGAYIEKGPTVLYIRSDGLIKGADDIGNIVVRSTPNGTPLLVKNVGEVRIGNATRYGAMCYNDEGEVAGAVVMMLKGGNSSEVIKNVKTRIAEIQKTLPEGVEIEPFLDRTKMVNNAIGTVRNNLLEGALIVIFVLILFLGNIRAGFIVASVIPLSMLFAVIMMNAFGVIGNLMSLGALDFGLIVDGAVFIVEAVLHQLAHNKQFAAAGFITPKQMDEEVKGASNKMMRSVVFGQIIILIVYLPTFTLQGIEGKMFKPMALTVAFALLGAFILSLTYVPMVSALLISRKYSGKKTISDRMMERLEEIYTKALDRALGIPKSLVLASIAAFAISIVVLSNMGGEFIPSLEEGDFAVETRVLTGSSLNTTIQASQQAVHVLLDKFPEIEKVVTKIGSGEIPTDPMPMDAGDMMIILKDKKEWTTAKTFPELADTMTKALQEVPGITTGFQFPVQMRFNELMTGARQDVVCKIYGENLDTLALYAKRLGDIAASVDGTQDLYVESVTGLPQIVIEYNRAAIAEFGLNIDEVNKVVNAGFAGQASGMVYEGEKRFELVVRLNGEQRKNITDVQNLLIPTPSGSQIPLYQVADVSIKDGPNQIQREDTRRRIVVGFNVSGRDVQSIVEELQAKVGKQIKLPAGYAITYGGAFENLNAAKARLGLAVPIALLLIFLLLYFSFNSIKQGLLIYSAIPLSAMGGIFA